MGLVLIVVGGLALFAIGAFIQAARGSEGRIISPTVTPVVCDDFCRNLHLARTARCDEEARARARDQDLANLMSLLDRALVTWLGLTAAAIAVAAIPFIGGFIASGLSAAAAIAFSAVVVLEGMIAVAIKQASDQRAAAQAARDAEAAARAAVIMNCAPDEWPACLGGLMPC